MSEGQRQRAHAGDPAASVIDPAAPLIDAPQETPGRIESSGDSIAESVSNATPAVAAASDAESPVVSRDSSAPVAAERGSRDDAAESERGEVALGKELFEHRWQPNDALASGGDGLGPVFNGHSCAECHSQGGLGGAGTNRHSVHAFEILPSKPGEEVRSGVIHAFATLGVAKEDAKGVERHFRAGKVVAGLQQSGSKELTSKRDIDAVRLVWLNSPALWGLGKIDRLSTDDLEQATNSTAGTRNGRTQRRSEGHFRLDADGRIGKFGWKGQFASLQDFVTAACANELGLSNEYAPQYVPGEFRPDSAARHDLSAEQVAALVKFVAALPEPKQVMPDDPAHRALVERGADLMGRIGCTECHIRDVGAVKNVYGDYRLHKVEDSLSDAYYVKDFKLEIKPRSLYPALDEWKTASLWGVADTAPYWHDGSAKTLEAAILRHARDAQSAADSYRRLDREDQQSVLAFLKTLRGPAEEQPAIGRAALSPAE